MSFAQNCPLADVDHIAMLACGEFCKVYDDIP